MASFRVSVDFIAQRPAVIWPKGMEAPALPMIILRNFVVKVNRVYLSYL